MRREYRRIVAAVLCLGLSLTLLTGGVGYASGRVVLLSFESEDIVNNHAQPNDSKRYAGQEPLVSVAYSTEKAPDANSKGSLKITALASEKGSDWGNVQFRTTLKQVLPWDISRWDNNGTIGFWIKGDGSGQKVYFQLYDQQMGHYWFEEPMVLDSTEWKYVEIPISELKHSRNGSDLDWDWIVVFSLQFALYGQWSDCAFYVDHITVSTK